MIRTTIALFALAVVICGLIVFRAPSNDDETASDPLGTPVQNDVDVTRAANADDATALALAAVAATFDPATETAPTAVMVSAPRRVDVARPNTDDTHLSDMANNVLAELGFAGVQPVTTNSQIQRQSTSDILAGIEAATGHRSVLEERETLEAIVIAALRAGETDESIDIIVNAAAAAGTVAVPEILVTSDGRVDTAVMLNNIVTQAQIASGGPAPAVPEVTPDNTAGMEVRVVQRATEAVQARFYTVQPGDSLGSISIKFYGVVSSFETIFEANKALLSSPDLIRAGQRLVIP